MGSRENALTRFGGRSKNSLIEFSSRRSAARDGTLTTSSTSVPCWKLSPSSVGMLGTLGLAFAAWRWRLSSVSAASCAIPEAVTLAGHCVCRTDPEHAVPGPDLFLYLLRVSFAGIRLDPTPTAIIALGVNGGAYAIEIIRGACNRSTKVRSRPGSRLDCATLRFFDWILLKPPCARSIRRCQASSSC